MSDVYLAGPYSGTPEQEDQNYDLHMKAFAELHRLGIAVFAPIVHSHEAARRYDLGGDWVAWADIDRRHIEAAKELWVLMIPGWSASRGTTAEVNFAKAIGKSFRYVQPSRLAAEAERFIAERRGALLHD